MATKKTDAKQGPMGLVAVAGVVLIGAIIWYFYPRQGSPATDQRYYSDDDGTTWFADDPKKVPPFMHNGKEAVLAMVYQTENGKPFVAYLVKYTDDAKAKQQASLNTPGVAPTAKRSAHTVKAGSLASGLLVKKPHGGSWLPEEDPAASDIKIVKAPDGGANVLPLTPE